METQRISMLLLSLLIVVLKETQGLVTEVPCQDTVELKIGDVYRIASDSDEPRPGRTCKRVFETSKETQVVVECSKFDIGEGNTFRLPGLGDSNDGTASGTELSGKVVGEVSGFGLPEEKTFEVQLRDVRSFNEYDCLVSGEEADDKNNVFPLVPKCGDKAWSYVVKDGNEFTVSSEEHPGSEEDCMLQFIIPADVSISLRCTTFSVPEDAPITSRYYEDSTDEENVDSITFSGNDLEGKIFGYTRLAKKSDDENEENEDGDRRWAFDITKSDASFECVVRGH